MTENDPLPTQRDIFDGSDSAFIAELEAVGFANAVVIGRGGFGVIYRCSQVALDRTVAVKVLTVELDEENKARFLREQRAMGRLTGHPNIVNVLQVGATESGHPYLAMQYYPRDSLDMWIRQHGPLPLDQVLRLGVKMAGAIESAHSLDIVHRDVKPANILLTDFGEPVLADFGIAHIAGGFQTASGTVTGSPAFTAPEVLSGSSPGPASDVYGLGATLFCALTGHAAFERRSGEQVVAQFLRITTQSVPDLRDSGVDDGMCAIVEKAMSRNAQDRPSAAALGDQLRQLQLRHGFSVDEMALAGPIGDQPQGRVPVPLGSPDRHSSVGQPPHARPSRSGALGNLSLELTSFVGRRSELIESKNLLSTSRLVTLTGIGGVGKTRLALRVATNSRQNYPDGVWLVELGKIHDGSLLVELVAETLGLRSQSARTLRDVLMDFLASRKALLVLDNCEHVVETVAEFAESLLRTCPTLRILATSREALCIDGESILRVAPLTVPDPDRESSLRGLPRYDSVALFTERASFAVPGFELTEENKATVVQICSRVDGLPLAIELAAARLRAMSPEQILQRLTDRFTLLTRGNRGAPTRQQTLRWSIDWSYQLCTTAEQQLWGRLSVFAGGFELDAVEGICGGDLSTGGLLDSLSSLVDKSILIRDEVNAIVRFRLLETIRDYGRERVEQTGEYAQLQRAHRDWYQRLVLEAEAGWISDRQLEWIGRLEREQPNLRDALKFSVTEPSDGFEVNAGLQMAAALFPFWLACGLLGEGRYWLDRALARDTGLGRAERVTALCADSLLAELQGDVVAGRSLVEEARVGAEWTAGSVTQANITQADGILALFSGDFSRARSDLEDALEVFSACGGLRQQVEGLLQLGWAHALHGDTAEALACNEQALTLTESHGESVYRSYALWGAGVARWRLGDSESSVRLLEQCLRLARLRNDPLMATPCLEALAWIACERDSARASVLLGAAEALGRAVGSSTVLFPKLLVFHEGCEQRARAALGQRSFDAARRRGSSLGFTGSIAYALGEQSGAAPSAGTSATELTKREWQVANLVVRGLTNKEIAVKLSISQRTVHGHVDHILAKLGFTSRTQIAAWISRQNRDDHIE